MADAIYTKKTHAQWRGPTTSDKYNERIDLNYKDIVNLINRLGLTEEAQQAIERRYLKDQLSILIAVEDLSNKVKALEDARRIISFRNDSQVDNDRFDSTPYEITEVDTLFHDSDYGLLTLPQVPSVSASKVHFTNNNGESLLPPSFEAIVNGRSGTVDSSGALVATTDLYGGFLPHSEVVWERNIIVDAPSSDGAVIDVYVKLPIDLLANATSNSIIVHPFPVLGCELLEVSYSTQTNINLNATDNYLPLNNTTIHAGDDDAIGWIPPGGWVGDSIGNCGPKTFYFDPKAITAVKLTLRQKNYYTENGKYIYSYGLSKFDVRYNKFLDSGKMMLRYDAPQGQTISSIDNVSPEIWNVSESELPTIFDYRVLWETSLNSGVYTTTPVAFSTRVWIEVTLRKTLGNGSPSLSGLVVSYS